MTKILIVTSGFRGILNCSLAIAKKLEDLGYEIVCASPGDVGKEVAEAGFSFYQQPSIYRPEKEKNKAWLVRKIWNRKSPMQLLGQDSFADLIQTLNIGLVIVDIELREYVFTAYQQNIPIILLSQWFNHLADDTFPLLCSYQYPSGDQEERKILSTELEIRKGRLEHKYIQLQKKTSGLDRFSMLEKYRSYCQFPIDQIELYTWPPPFTFKNMPTLFCNNEELEFPHIRPENHTYIGPQIWERSHGGISQRLTDFIDFCSRSKRNLVYATVGTLSKEYSSFFNRLLRAVYERNDLMLIISHGNSKVHSNYINDSVLLCDYVPQYEVLIKADLCINHAGINTINECLYLEVPMLIYTAGEHDQPGCTKRLQYHQLAHVGDLVEDDYRRISTRISNVLKDSKLKQKMATARQHLEAIDWESRLENIINDQLNLNK
ncbi:MAG: glycosyltransferase [Bacteroidota bacterium]